LRFKRSKPDKDRKEETMSVQISKAELNRAHEFANRAKSALGKVKAQAEHTAEKAIRTVEMGAMAFGLGVVQGRTATPEKPGGIEIMGMPLELILGAGLNLAGYFGVGGKHSDHLNNLGDGALAAWLTAAGVQIGVQMAAKTKGASQGQVQAPGGGGNLPAGAPTAAKGVGLTREEIAEAVRQAAA
jgi:hypothetical protein